MFKRYGLILSECGHLGSFRPRLVLDRNRSAFQGPRQRVLSAGRMRRDAQVPRGAISLAAFVWLSHSRLASHSSPRAATARVASVTTDLALFAQETGVLLLLARNWAPQLGSGGRGRRRRDRGSLGLGLGLGLRIRSVLWDHVCPHPQQSKRVERQNSQRIDHSLHWHDLDRTGHEISFFYE